MQICKRCGLDYREAGKNHVVGGNEGGTFMAPWGMGKMIPKLCSSNYWDSFGSIVGFSAWFVSQGFTLCGVTDSLCTEMGMLSVWFYIVVSFVFFSLRIYHTFNGSSF